MPVGGIAGSDRGGRPDEDGIHCGQNNRQAGHSEPVNGVHKAIRAHLKHLVRGYFAHPEPHRRLRKDKKLELLATQPVRAAEARLRN